MRHRVQAVDDGTRKLCSQCGIEKPLGDFGKNKQSKDGYRSNCKECHSKYWIPYKALIQPHQRAHHLLRAYGLTQEEYQSLYDRQQGRCAACGDIETTIHYNKALPLAVDHCHKTGTVRGLLCTACNRALGLLNDDAARIKALLRYIHERAS
jgi:Recombination endonuclease VII